MYLETINEKAFRSFLSNPAISVLDGNVLDIPYRVHGECCISVSNNDYSAAVEAFFCNDVSFQPE